MRELIVESPAHLEVEMREVANALGVSLDALAAYFFAREVVHT